MQKIVNKLTRKEKKRITKKRETVFSVMDFRQKKAEKERGELFVLHRKIQEISEK